MTELSITKVNLNKKIMNWNNTNFINTSNEYLIGLYLSWEFRLGVARYICRSPVVGTGCVHAHIDSIVNVREGMKSYNIIDYSQQQRAATTQRHKIQTESTKTG